MVKVVKERHADIKILMFAERMFKNVQRSTVVGTGGRKSASYFAYGNKFVQHSAWTNTWDIVEDDTYDYFVHMYNAHKGWKPNER